MWWVTGVSLGVFLREITLKENAPVTLTDSDLSELLAAVKAGDMTDTIRTSLAWVLQQLIEAELTSSRSCSDMDRRSNLPARAAAEARSGAWPADNHTSCGGSVG